MSGNFEVAPNVLFDCTISGNHIMCQEYLESSKDAINSRNRNGETPLHLANHNDYVIETVENRSHIRGASDKSHVKDHNDRITYFVLRRN